MASEMATATLGAAVVVIMGLTGYAGCARTPFVLVPKVLLIRSLPYLDSGRYSKANALPRFGSSTPRSHPANTPHSWRP